MVDTQCVALFLQHGARIKHRTLCGTEFYRQYVQHSEAFIELLLAADTDFSGVRQRIASVDTNSKRKSPNLAVIDQKLSQPMNLRMLCVISVRRQLRSVSDTGMWVRIEKFPLSSVFKDQLKLRVW